MIGSVPETVDESSAPAAKAPRSLPSRIAPLVAKSLLGAAALLSALIVVAGAAIYVGDRYKEKFRWRQAEYRKLQALHAGYSIDRFEAVLGTPVFSRKDPQTHLREDTFRRRDYWVQVVSRRDGTVTLYAVTSCDDNFRPEFRIPGFSGGTVRVVLRQSPMAGVIPSRDAVSTRANYFTGNTSNSYFYDEWYGGNPSDYKEYAWGVNDACAGEDGLKRTYKQAGYPTLRAFPYRGLSENGGPSVVRFRRRAIINTYAETPPRVSLKYSHRSFQTGVDRILTRTAG